MVTAIDIPFFNALAHIFESHFLSSYSRYRQRKKLYKFIFEDLTV